jgi:hypothetical protein
MAFVVIGGIELRVVEGSAKRRSDLYQGGRERMRAGNVISTEDTPMRVFDFDVDLFSDAEETALRLVTPRGQSVSVSGDWMGSFSALVDIGDATPWTTYDGTGQVVYKTVSLHVEEVAL